jgi:hypothetical protein
MPIKLTIHSLEDRVKRLEDLSGSIQDASNEISSITNNLIQKANLDAFLTTELFPNVGSQGALINQSGIRIGAGDAAVITKQSISTPFTSGKYTTMAYKPGPWGMFVEPSTLTMGIPYAENRGFQVVGYGQDSVRKTNFIYAHVSGTGATVSASVGIGPIFGLESLTTSSSIINGTLPYKLDPVIETRLGSLYGSPETHKKQMTLSVAGNMQIRSGSGGQEGNLNVQNDITTKFLYVAGNSWFKDTLYVEGDDSSAITNFAWIGIANADGAGQGRGSGEDLSDYDPDAYAIVDIDKDDNEIELWAGGKKKDSGPEVAANDYAIITGNPTYWSVSGKGKILVSEVNIYSDSRNKKIILKENLYEKYKNINVVDYVNKKDGSRKKLKGVLAQELEINFPDFVSKTEGLVADIMQSSVSNIVTEDGTRVIIKLNKETDIKEKDLLTIIEPNSQNNNLEVLEVIDSCTFIVPFFEFNKEKPVFVYGRHVKDHRTVDYNKIHMTTVEVVQELVKKTETLESENVQLKNTLSQFETRLAALESKV